MLKVEGPASATPQALLEVEMSLFSRTSLNSLITNPSFDLYPAERRELPLEEIVAHMRQQIRVRLVPGRPDLVSVSFAYREQEKARAVAGQIAERFVQTSVAQNQSQAALWHTQWGESEPAPAGVQLAVVSPANAPSPISPNRLAFVAAGCAVGLLLGLIAIPLLHRPRKTLQIAAFALAGGALGLAASWIMPYRTTSIAVLRFAAPSAPQRVIAEMKLPPAAQQLKALQEQALNQEALAKLIRDPSLDLYAQERTREPIEQVVQRMRSDVRIARITPVSVPNGDFAFLVSYSYPDPLKAQAVLRSLLARMVEENLSLQSGLQQSGNPDLRKAYEHRLGDNLELLDPASLPERPLLPHLRVFGGDGITFGLCLGTFFVGSRRKYPRDEAA